MEAKAAAEAKEADLLLQWDGAKKEAELAYRELTKCRVAMGEAEAVSQSEHHLTSQWARYLRLLKKLAGRLMLHSMRQHRLRQSLKAAEVGLSTARIELEESQAKLLESSAQLEQAERGHVEQARQAAKQKLSSSVDTLTMKWHQAQLEKAMQAKEAECREALETLNAEMREASEDSQAALAAAQRKSTRLLDDERRERREEREAERQKMTAEMAAEMEKVKVEVANEVAGRYKEQVRDLRAEVQAKMTELQALKKKQVK